MSDQTSASNAAETYMRQGNEAAAKGDFEVAEEAFEQAVAAAPSNAKARYNLGLARQNLGDPEGAIASYMRAIRQDPALMEAYINLGNLYGELGLEQEALEVFQRALDLQPGNDQLFINVGDAYRSLGFYRRRDPGVSPGQILDSDNKLAADNLAEVRERVRMQEENISDLERSVDEDPRDLSRYADWWRPISRRIARKMR